MRILVVEDDELLLDGLSVGLGLAGFTVDSVSRCDDALAALLAQKYDGVILDLMLPDGTGLDILSDLRKRGDETPVLLLTARDQVADRVAGLDAGADDYLGKPFDLEELAARMRAVVRRGKGRACGHLVWFDGEFALLASLMEQPRNVVAKSSLEETLYGWQEEVESNAVEVHIHKLRSKLGADFIETVRGVGYRLKGDGS